METGRSFARRSGGWQQCRPPFLFGAWRALRRRRLDSTVKTCKPQSMLALLFAAHVVAPDPSNVGKWFSYNDVPLYLVKENSGVWQVPVRIDVASDGKIVSCDAEMRGRVPALDAHTCNIIRRRARFRPAQIDGIPTHGVYRTAINYFVSEAAAAPPSPSNADVQVVVNRLPSHLKSPASVKVAFAVDASGAKSSCAADDTANLQIIRNDPALVPLACEQVVEKYRATPAKVEGRPVISVQNALVEFFAQPDRDAKKTN